MMISKTKYLGYGILILAIIGIIFISGCIQQEVTCNPPYIKVGISCCLDQNNNSICDKDEAIATQTQQTAFTTTSTSNTSGTSGAETNTSGTNNNTSLSGTSTTETNGTTETSDTTSGTSTTGTSTSGTTSNNNTSSSGISSSGTTTSTTSSTTSGTTESKEKFTVIVSKVIDGDTVKLQTGKTARLLGINAPEKGQPYYEESTNRLKELVHIS